MANDAIFSQYEELHEQLRGISPKLKLYSEIQEQIKALELKMDGGILEAVKTQGQKRKKGKIKYFSKFHYVRG